MATFVSSSPYRAYAVCVLLVCHALAVSGKYCYQCDSTLDHNCQEKWDDSLSTNQQKYRECRLWDAKYCIKVTGLWGGVVGTHRFCSSRDMGDQCQDIWFPDHDRMYRACVYTCSGDGCNSASLPSSMAALLIPALLLVMHVWRRL
ncbi:UPAR/Ly6 domain-containing protein bou-like [Babylonia areolata]|uniref:UPAR/Ly6 domain-containing protein bou-like n=1 Tax=Babylonia areolata TaxID=304850 RepID=UPI003FCF1BD9